MNSKIELGYEVRDWVWDAAWFSKRNSTDSLVKNSVDGSVWYEVMRGVWDGTDTPIRIAVRSAVRDSIKTKERTK